MKDESVWRKGHDGSWKNQGLKTSFGGSEVYWARGMKIKGRMREGKSSEVSWETKD